MANRMAEAVPALLEQFHSLYLAELAQLAEELRPRFESGELRGFTDEDDKRDCRTEPGPYRPGEWKPPMFQLEDLCEAHFGLDIDAAETDAAAQEIFRRAYLIRAVSPGDAHTEDGQPTAGQAVCAVALDVIAIARARGWYTPSADEHPSVDKTAWAREAA